MDAGEARSFCGIQVVGCACLGAVGKEDQKVSDFEEREIA
jgi:hypothetical protein